MTLANVLKILLLVATVLQVVAGLNGIIKPEISAILAGIATAIFAFVRSIGDSPTEPKV